MQPAQGARRKKKVSIAQSQASEKLNFSRSGPRDMHAQQRYARDRGVHWDEGLGGWIVASFDGVRRVMSNPGRFTSEGLPTSEAFGSQAMLVTDSPIHHKLRGAWAEKMSTPGVAQLEAQIETFIKQAFEHEFEALNRGEAADLVPGFWGITSRVISYLMDTPFESAAQFIAVNKILSDGATIPVEKGSPRYQEREAAKAKVFDFLRPIVEERRAALASGEKRTDLISLIAALQDSDGVTEQMVLDNLLNLYLGAFETTALWMGNIAIRIYEDKALNAALRADPALIPNACEEIMRIDSVVQLNMRIVRTDTELDGTKMKAGDRVFVMQGAANRDPAVFEDPERFDIHRHVKLHLGFGFGFHQCLGQFLARLEARLFVKYILHTFPELVFEEKDFGRSWDVNGPHKLVARRPGILQS
ncbi:hypothetical protein A8G00_21255 [Sphingobium sp. SA916]|nr:hypothetical protein A8G00_21255 [Sphingobium sp. SA916]